LLNCLHNNCDKSRGARFWARYQHLRTYNMLKAQRFYFLGFFNPGIYRCLFVTLKNGWKSVEKNQERKNPGENRIMKIRVKIRFSFQTLIMYCFSVAIVCLMQCFNLSWAMFYIKRIPRHTTNQTGYSLATPLTRITNSICLKEQGDYCSTCWGCTTSLVQ